MKRRILTAACVLLLAAGLGADELTDIYKKLYEVSPSIIQKWELMQSLVDSGSAADAPYYAETLAELNSLDTARFKLAEKEAYEKILRLLCAKLGEYAHRESQDELIKIAAGSGSAVLRSDALVALGKVGGVKHIEIVVRMLEELSIKSVPDKIYGEQLAYGCIMALSKFKDIRGWSPVFDASNGWYSGRIKQLAAAALPSIVDDPTEAAKQAIEDDAIEVKRFALKYAMESKASQANKVSTALLGLKKGIETRSVYLSQMREPGLLRKAAMEYLIELGDSGSESVALCRQAWNPADRDEKLLIMSVYGANASDAAGEALADIITTYNLKRLSEVTSNEEELLMKAAIQNAGKAKNQKAFASLVAVSANSKWSPGVLQEAKLAQDAIKAK